IQRDLPKLIEQSLMVSAVKAKLKKEQLEQVEKQMDAFFDMHVETLKTQFKVGSAAELEALLQEQGMSLETMRRMFGERSLAAEYVKARMGDAPPITRQELLAQYNANLKEYAQPARV